MLKKYVTVPGGGWKCRNASAIRLKPFSILFK